ncbi:hypothetical protein MAM1_0159c06895 [Mucor ambiguus]|uniref:Uncharacterized protein n=1 Tax=Mucor ambiguus TaxID=91626 RepID=A0A0C9MYR4_9FUNG|nr:hypothetical protein MAM1_0159c06895 [Mucor ambiguus]
MINRKTKRNSPPPLHTTTAAVLDHKLTESGFAKWSKMLQLISPPNKKRRAVALIGQLCENSDDEDPDEASESESQNENDDDEHQEILVKRAQRPDSMNKQKVLNRRAMYIPNPIQQQQYNDGPKDAWHKWALYRATYHKLRRNSVPLLEGLHLRRMLVHLQQDEFIQDHIQQQHKVPAHRNHSNSDDEDNIPLGTLLENKKLVTAVPPRCSSPPLPPMMTAPMIAAKPKAFYQRTVVPRPPAALNLFYRQPCYYYNNLQSFPVQFI